MYKERERDACRERELDIYIDRLCNITTHWQVVDTLGPICWCLITVNRLGMVRGTSGISEEHMLGRMLQ